jgi:predicted ATPase
VGGRTVSVPGELLLHRQKARVEATTCFQQAIKVARRQKTKSLEMPVAMSLVHLWQPQGKRKAARELLVPIYGCFTEDFDTTDLKEAKALLAELA